MQLLYEVPELRRIAQPLSFDSLIRHTTQTFLEQHFMHIDRAVIARKAYVINKCVLGMISQYLDEKPEFLNRSDAISEVTQVAHQYIKTLHPRSLRAKRARR